MIKQDEWIMYFWWTETVYKYDEIIKSAALNSTNQNQNVINLLQDGRFLRYTGVTLSAFTTFHITTDLIYLNSVCLAGKYIEWVKISFKIIFL